MADIIPFPYPVQSSTEVSNEMKIPPILEESIHSIAKPYKLKDWANDLFLKVLEKVADGSDIKSYKGKSSYRSYIWYDKEKHLTVEEAKKLVSNNETVTKKRRIVSVICWKGSIDANAKEYLLEHKIDVEEIPSH